MERLHAKQVDLMLAQWLGKSIYIHLEVNPGAYWRNGRALLGAAHIRGDGPYRLFLKLDGDMGLIQVDQLTHMEITDDLLICIGYDDQGRLARTIEISTIPFAV